MNALHFKIVITAFIFVFILLSGRRLKKTAKPYNPIVLAIHKLISAGIMVAIVITVNQINKSVSLNTGEMLLSISMIFVFLGAVVSGGFLSTGKQLPSLVEIIHKASSLASIVFAGILLFLLKDRL